MPEKKSRTKKVKTKTKSKTKSKKRSRRATQHQEVRQSVRIHIGDKGGKLKDQDRHPQVAPIVFNAPYTAPRGDDGGAIRALLEVMRGGAHVGPGFRDLGPTAPPLLAGVATAPAPPVSTTGKPSLEDMLARSRAEAEARAKEAPEPPPLAPKIEKTEPVFDPRAALGGMGSILAKKGLEREIRVAEKNIAAMEEDLRNATDALVREQIEKELAIERTRLTEARERAGILPLTPPSPIREPAESPPSLTDVLSKKADESKEPEGKWRENIAYNNDSKIQSMLGHHPVTIIHDGVDYNFVGTMSGPEVMELIERLRDAGYKSKRGSSFPRKLRENINKHDVGDIDLALRWLDSQRHSS